MNLEQLKSQIEFYFSNCNYRKDSFLRKTYEENNGMPISTLLSFNKLKEEKIDAEKIEKVFKEKIFSFLNIENGKIIKTDMEEYKAYEAIDTDNLTIYISNLTGDFLTVKTYLNKFFNFSLLRLRKDKYGKHTGSAFVELKNKEEVEKVLKMEIEKPEEASENEEVKKVKKEKEFLKLQLKTDFLKESENKKKRKEEIKIEREFKKTAKNKLYRLKLLNKKTDLKKIRNITRAAFCDQKNMMVRFKNDQKEDEIKFRDFVLKKLSEKEERNYFNNFIKK